jgi:hypothetical protein
LHRFLCTTKGDVKHGCKIREESTGQSREGDARTEARHAEKRKLGQEGEEPQTGHRHRTLRSATRRRQGAVEEIVEEVEFEEGVLKEIQLEEIVVEKVFIEEELKEVFIEEEVSVETFCVHLRIKLDPQMAQMYTERQ